MDSIPARHLFDLSLEVGPPLDLRGADGTGRCVFHVPGGTFAGERLRGSVLPVSGDWLTTERGYSRVEVRAMLRTDDNALIYMTYGGINTLTAAIRDRIAGGEDVDAGEYYFRTAPMFETAAPQYDWLNRVVAVGMGKRTGAGVEYRVCEVL
ncbi:DUF3237 family protein [Pseudooceanicola sp. 216_PA32_1]|uniref:UPF0311 protein GLS40_00555 n=1 Tax=Pseudooceanicola pacificus TaxID=2676438 RepID=A0A844VXU4_9RHOB|nr:DUF3237 domain-containing protein [Pseudooceanicola pacificus]MWB76506.1 DUF3237 family protein [Pseudooceanicola pacificus]